MKVRISWVAVAGIAGIVTLLGAFVIFFLGVETVKHSVCHLKPSCAYDFTWECSEPAPGNGPHMISNASMTCQKAGSLPWVCGHLHNGTTIKTPEPFFPSNR